MIHNEVFDVKVYHYYFHIVCSLSQTRAYMMSLMALCVVNCWPLYGQRVRCVPYAFNQCPHSHMKRLYVEGWIKPKQKCIIEVEVECAMQNKHIDGLTINHNPTPLPEQERMQVLKVKKWIIFQNRLGTLLIIKLSRQGCIFIVMGGKLS